MAFDSDKAKKRIRDKAQRIRDQYLALLSLHDPEIDAKLRTIMDNSNRCLDLIDQGFEARLKVGNLIAIEGGRNKKTTVRTSKRGRPSEDPGGLAGPPDFTMPPGKQPRADYLLRAEQVAEQLRIPKSRVRRPRLPSTRVAVGTGRSRIHHGQLMVPPGRKERVVEKINQLETREGVLTSGATELLRSLKVELGKIEQKERGQ